MKSWGQQRAAVALAPARPPSPRLTANADAERRGRAGVERRLAAAARRSGNELGFGGGRSDAGYIRGVYNDRIQRLDFIRVRDPTADDARAVQMAG